MLLSPSGRISEPYEPVAARRPRVKTTVATAQTSSTVSCPCRSELRAGRRRRAATGEERWFLAGMAKLSRNRQWALEAGYRHIDTRSTSATTVATASRRCCGAPSDDRCDRRTPGPHLRPGDAPLVDPAPGRRYPQVQSQGPDPLQRPSVRLRAREADMRVLDDLDRTNASARARGSGHRRRRGRI